jgi:hypothetical protein
LRGWKVSAVIAWVATMAALAPLAASAQTSAGGEQFYRVANTLPPDAYLSLRTQPSTSAGQRVDTLANGTLLRVQQKRSDGWWQVQVVANGESGWALSGTSGRAWILCCTLGVALPVVPTRLVFSPAALKKLTDNGEEVHLAVEFYGSTGKGFADDFPGEITLGSQDMDVQPGQAVSLGGIVVSQVDLNAVQPQIWMNVYSSRKVFQDNLLDCDAIQEPLGDITKAGALDIHCVLIGEQASAATVIPGAPGATPPSSQKKK